MSTDPLFVFNSWNGAQYIDWWMLVHLLGGVLVGLILRYFGVDLLTSLTVAAVLVIGWEVYEGLAKIHEPWSNTIIDVIVGFLGFTISYKIFPLSSKGINLLVIFSVFIFWLLLNLWGWISWKNRTVETSKSTVDETFRQNRT